MTIQDALSFFQSEHYKHIMMSMLWATTIGFIALTAIAATLYVRSRKHADPRDATAVLIATLFDSFVVSLLYAAIELSFLADNFRQEAQVIDSWIVVVAPLLSLGFRSAIFLYIAYISVSRLLILAQWLAEREKNE